MAGTPAFVVTPAISAAALSAANSARDGSGTLVEVITAAASGTRIDAINIKATGATTAGMIRLYVFNGATSFLFAEVAIPAITASATLETFQTTIYYPEGLIIPSTFKIKASTERSEGFNVIARGGNY